MYKNIYILILSFSILCSCHEDYDNKQSTSIDAEPEIRIDTEITGKITESDGSIAERSYDIIVNGDAVTTSNYIFQEALQFVRKFGQVITIISEGEERAKVLTTLVENDINYLDIHLFPEWNKTDVEINNSVDISSSIVLEVNKLSDASGTIVVSEGVLTYGNLEEEKWQRQLGNHAYKDVNTLLSLDVKEAFFISIADQQGSNLQIDINEPSIVTYNNGENALALFYLNEELSRWEYVQNLDGNNSAEILKTGYFSLATYTDGVYVEGKLMKEEKPIAYQLYSWESDGFSQESFTTLRGNWLSILPQSSTLSYRVSNPCKEEIQNYSLVTESDNIDNVNYELTEEDISLYNLQTVVINCDGEIKEGAAIRIADSNGELVYAYNNNELDAWMSVCEDSFEISAYDIESQTEGVPLDWDATIEEPILFLMMISYLMLERVIQFHSTYHEK